MDDVNEIEALRCFLRRIGPKWVDCPHGHGPQMPPGWYFFDEEYGHLPAGLTETEEQIMR